MIEFNSDQIRRAESLLGGIRDALPKAQRNAINRSLITARAEAIRIVREQYIVSASTIRKTMKIKNAGLNKPVGFISSTGSPIALSKFDISPTRPTKKSNVTLHARGKFSENRKPIKSAFVARMSNGHIGAFKVNKDNKFMKDKGPRPKKRGIGNTKGILAINELYGPSVPQMLGAKNVSKQIEEKAAETLDKRLEHEINRILEGHNR
jgi:hypothetical protein